MPPIPSPLRDQIADWLRVAAQDPPRYFSLKDAEAVLPPDVFRQVVTGWKAYDKLWWGFREVLYELEYKNPDTLPYFELYKHARLRYSDSLEHANSTLEQRARARIEADEVAGKALTFWNALDANYKIHFNTNIKLHYPRADEGGDLFRTLPELKLVLAYFPETSSEIGTALQIIIRKALEAEVARLDKLADEDSLT